MSKPNEEKSDTLKEVYLETFQWMLFARAFEEKIAALYRAGKIVGGVYIGKGQEAFSAALGIQLDREKGDIFGPLIRDQAGRLAFGEPLLDAARTYLGSANGPMKGRDGNIHRGRPTEGVPAMISHLGSLIPVVNGMLMAKRFKGETGFVGGVTIGDGGTSTGAFHEAINQAAVENLPLVIAIANNQYAYSTATERQFACEDLADRAAGYGVKGYSIDATDPTACVETFTEAVERARNGEGPQMVVGKLLRLAGHGEHDDARYVAESAKEGPYSRDCIDVAREQIAENGWQTPEWIDSRVVEFQLLVDEATASAQSDPSPSPLEESWKPLATTHLIEGISNWRK